MRGVSRVEWWQWVELGWPETSPATSLAAAGMNDIAPAEIEDIDVTIKLANR